MPSSAFKTCALDRKSTRLNSSHTLISYAVFFLKKDRVTRRLSSFLLNFSRQRFKLLPCIRSDRVPRRLSSFLLNSSRQVFKSFACTFFHSSAPPRDLPSFPPRRSSD